MKRVLMIGFVLAVHTISHAIVPPRHEGIKLPDKVLRNLQSDPNYYMPERGFVKQVQRFRESRDRLSKAGASARIMQDEASLKVFLPVLCAQYSDLERPEWPRKDMQAKLFGDWPTGSMRDYYDEVSLGKLELSGVVHGWYKVTNDSEYYKEYGDTGARTTGELLRELFTMSDDSVDYGQYDNDGPDGIPNSGDDDGYVDVVAIVHSGRGAEAGGNEIWSHSSRFRHYYGAPHSTNDAGANGGFIKIDDYIIQPALDGTQMVEIGVFCHEFGHALGLPDLYDRDYSSEGIGYWGLMAGGSYGCDGRSPEKPCHMTAWCKEALGWVTTIVVRENQPLVEIPKVESSGVVYKLWTRGEIDPYNYGSGLGLSSPMGREYFLVENRQNSGFNVNLVEPGLFIWHVDNSVSSWNDDENHKLVDLESADGRTDLDRGKNDGDRGDPFPGSSGNRTFNRTSVPNSFNYSGVNSKVAVLNISDSADTMYADLEVVANDIAYYNYQLDDGEGDDNGFLDPGETGRYYPQLINYGAPIASLQATLRSDDETITIIDSIAIYTDLAEDGVGINSGDPFIISASPEAEYHPIRCQLEIETGSGYRSAFDFVIMMNNIYILLVDDSFGELGVNERSIAEYYQHALRDLNVSYYDEWSTLQEGTPDSAVLARYGTLIWFTGSNRNTLSPREQDNLSSYLLNGGRLILSGQNIGQDLVGKGSDSDRDFYEQFLHARYVSESVPENPIIMMTGLSGDPISEKWQPYFFISGGDGADNQRSPGILEPQDDAVPFLDYFGTGLTGKHGALHYKGDYSLVYLAFGFEGINDIGSRTVTRRQVMGSILEWIQNPGISSGVNGPGAGTDAVPRSYVVRQNYPNPFNPETRIEYELSAPGRVSIVVYNLSGQQVATLVDEQKREGRYIARWNGRDAFGAPAASGVYLYRFISGDFSRTIKMTLLR